MRYGSVCSGIEAASVAWASLGWEPVWFAEIEKFPSAVLAQRWPDVTNLGDMTKIAAAVRAGTVAAPDVLVGGTPCQAFSVAGARKGLSDHRGQLTISYGELADAIDDTRTAAGEQPAIIVWENVPGVLSSKDNAFGSFLGLLAGEDCDLQPPGGKWKNAGFVHGPKRTIAWRVLDAQYFGVAQRRRRVFVVASARTDFDPKKVLFESEGVRRDTAPSRSPRTAVAALTANGVGTCGADDNQGQAGHLIPQCVTGDVSHTLKAEGFDGSEDGTGRGTPIVAAFGGGNCSGELEVAACLTARGQRIDFEVETFLAQYSSTGQGAWAEGPGTLRAREQESHEHLAVMAFPERMSGTQCASAEDISPSLMSRNPTAIAFGSKDHGQDASEELSPTLRAAGHGDSHANAGAPPAVAYGFQPRIARNGRGDMGDIVHSLNAQSGETGKGDAAPCVALAFAENNRGEVRLQDGDGSITGPLSTGGGKPGQGYPAVVAFQERGRDGGRALEINGDLAYALTAPNGGGRAQERNIVDFRTMAVRRLTPVECERLQGFPDNHTFIPTQKRKKITADEYAYVRHHFPEMTAEEAFKRAVDGPRYKAIGNSMAVPVMHWIGERIAAALPETKPVRKWQRPFLKWAGGKYSLLPELDYLIPAGKRLIEPFVGGGSVFLNSNKHERFLLADVNPDLINLYQMLTVVPEKVTAEAHLLFASLNTEEGYMAVRDDFNAQRLSGPDRAAAFLFLNRHCFNGLIRYNRASEFNVGWGKYPAPYFPQAEIDAFTSMAHSCVFMNAGYQRTLALAGEGDVIYCDPPYEPMPGTAGFTSYAAGGFTWDDQVALAENCVAAHQRGARVVISNSTSPRIIELYAQHGFKLHEVSARRAISSKGSTRETAKDIVAIL